MQERCNDCPLVDSELIRRFCSQCKRETDDCGKAQRFHSLGMLLYQNACYAEAATTFQAAMDQSDFFLVESAFDLTLCLMRLSRYDEALEAIDQVLERHQSGDSLYLKGLIFRYLSRYDEAKLWLTKSDAAGYARAGAELANLEFAQDLGQMESGDLPDDPEKRLAYLVGCLSGLEPLSPNHEAGLLSKAGDAARDAGDYGCARRYYTSACQANLTAETATQLAEFVLDFGGEDEAEIAESWLHQALSMEGEHGRAHFCLGRMQWNRGQGEQAFHSMLSALRADPSDAYVIFETAELAAELGNIPFCLTLLKKLEVEAGEDHYWLDRARMLRRSIGAF